MKYCSNKDVNKLIIGLLKKEWVFRKGKKHGRLSHPNYRGKIIIPSSPSDHRVLMNIHREIRHYMLYKHLNNS